MRYLFILLFSFFSYADRFLLVDDNNTTQAVTGEKITTLPLGWKEYPINDPHILANIQLGITKVITEENGELRGFSTFPWKNTSFLIQSKPNICHQAFAEIK